MEWGDEQQRSSFKNCVYEELLLQTDAQESILSWSFSVMKGVWSLPVETSRQDYTSQLHVQVWVGIFSASSLLLLLLLSDGTLSSEVLQRPAPPTRWSHRNRSRLLKAANDLSPPRSTSVHLGVLLLSSAAQFYVIMTSPDHLPGDTRYRRCPAGASGPTPGPPASLPGPTHGGGVWWGLWSPWSEYSLSVWWWGSMGVSGPGPLY